MNHFFPHWTKTKLVFLAQRCSFCWCLKFEKITSQHVLTVEHSTSIISCYVCLNVPVPVSNRPRGSASVERSVWSAPLTPLHLECSIFLTLFLPCNKHFTCLYGLTDCKIPSCWIAFVPECLFYGFSVKLFWNVVLMLKGLQADEEYAKYSNILYI